jgi:hypothetical protein
MIQSSPVIGKQTVEKVVHRFLRSQSEAKDVSQLIVNDHVHGLQANCLRLLSSVASASNMLPILCAAFEKVMPA